MALVLDEVVRLAAAAERGERLAEAGRAFHALALDHLPLGKQSYEMRQAGIAWRNALAAYEAKERP